MAIKFTLPRVFLLKYVAERGKCKRSSSWPFFCACIHFTGAAFSFPGVGTLSFLLGVLPHSVHKPGSFKNVECGVGVCVCVWYVCVWCVCVCDRSQSSMLGTFFYRSLPYLWDKVSCSTRQLSFWLEWLTCKPQGFSCLCPPSTEVTRAYVTWRFRGFRSLCLCGKHFTHWVPLPRVTLHFW